LASLCLIAILCGSCIKEPKINNISNIEITGLSDSLLTFSYTIGVENPNSIDIKMDNFQYNISANNVVFGSGKMNDKITLPKKETTKLNAECLVDMNKSKNLLNYFIENDSVELIINYSFNTRPFNIKIEDSKKQYFPKSLLINYIHKYALQSNYFKINRVEIANMNVETSEWKIQFEITNPLSFEFGIDSILLNINAQKDGSNTLGNIALKDPIRLASKESKQYTVLCKIDNAVAAKSFFDKLLSNNAFYYIQGNVFLDIYQAKISTKVNQAIDIMTLPGMKNKKSKYKFQLPGGPI
jgi:LEA14-like dessication related protein